jgi:hypothetical protein
MADDKLTVDKSECKGCWLAIRGLEMIANMTDDEKLAAMAWKIIEDIATAKQGG